MGFWSRRGRELKNLRALSGTWCSQFWKLLFESDPTNHGSKKVPGVTSIVLATPGYLQILVEPSLRKPSAHFEAGQARAGVNGQ